MLMYKHITGLVNVNFNFLVIKVVTMLQVAKHCDVQMERVWL